MKRLWPVPAALLLALGCGSPTADNLEFFNGLSGKLLIELSEPAEKVGELANEAAPPSAKILSLELRAEVFMRSRGEFRDLTAEELAAVALAEPRIRMRGLTDAVIEHEAPNGVSFTVAQLLLAVEETERQTRANSGMLDGIDVHHVYFEGMALQPDGSWQISWGS